MLNKESLRITFSLDEVPENTPEDAVIYITGDFCHWYPDMNKYRMSKMKDGHYTITLELPDRDIEYKYTRGSWETSECRPDGTGIQNRKLKTGLKEEVRDTVYAWEDKLHSSSEQVRLIDDFVYQYRKSPARKIWIYTPPDYDESDRIYPLLIMLPGQNLFDNFYAEVREWGIDKKLNYLSGQGITCPVIAGIEIERDFIPVQDYQFVNMRKNSRAGHLAFFILEQLIPYMSSHFRVNTSPHDIGIIGSEWLSKFVFYTGVQHPEIFTKIGLFSPRLSPCKELYSTIDNIEQPNHYKFSMLLGALEGQERINHTMKLHEHLLIKGIPENQLFMDIKHNEDAGPGLWGNAFPDIYMRFFNQSLPSLDSFGPVIHEPVEDNKKND